MDKSCKKIFSFRDFILKYIATKYNVKRGNLSDSPSMIFIIKASFKSRFYLIPFYVEQT